MFRISVILSQRADAVAASRPQHQQNAQVLGLWVIANVLVDIDILLP